MVSFLTEFISNNEILVYGVIGIIVLFLLTQKFTTNKGRTSKIKRRYAEAFLHINIGLLSVFFTTVLVIEGFITITKTLFLVALVGMILTSIYPLYVMVTKGKISDEASLIAFYIFNGFMSIILAYTLDLWVENVENGTELILMAVGLTLIITIVGMIIGSMMSLGKARIGSKIAFYFLILLIVVSILNNFVQSEMLFQFDLWFGAILFSALIVIDVALLKDDKIPLGLLVWGIYLDIINLFLRMLLILSGSNRN